MFCISKPRHKLIIRYTEVCRVTTSRTFRSVNLVRHAKYIAFKDV